MPATIRLIARGLLCCVLAAIFSGCEADEFATAVPPTLPPAAETPLPARPTSTPSRQGADDTPAPRALTLATAPGKTMLELEKGVGGSFRIGADGSIRVLDSDNKRLLFFDRQGALVNTREFPEANSPFDFIVSGDGDIYVLDYAKDNVDRAGPIYHYGADGALQETIPVGTDFFPNGIMLDGSKNLFLSGPEGYWTVVQDGAIVAPQDQAATGRPGWITPRSPMAFVNDFDPDGNLAVRIRKPANPNEGQTILTAADQASAGGTARSFFNVDREMNLYLTNDLREAPSEGVAVWRYGPTGDLLGGARIDIAGCEWNQPERQFYIDQAGAAWVLCHGAEGTAVRRYDLLDFDSQPLPEVGTEPADVPWRPGNPTEAG